MKGKTKEKVISLAIAVCLIVTSLPFATIESHAASASKINTFQVQDRLTKLKANYNGTYFTNVKGTYGKKDPNSRAYHSAYNCKYCNVVNVIETKKIKNEYSSLNKNYLAEHAGSYWGSSCFGFVSFAGFYVYGNGENVDVKSKEVASWNFKASNYENLKECLKPGDMLRINGHSMIYYGSISKSKGIKVIDSNWNYGNTNPCKVSIHYLSFNNSYYNNKTLSIYRGTNYTTVPNPTISATSSSSGITIETNEIKGADKYIFYRATSKNGSYKIIKTTTSTSYKDTSIVKGNTYYYKVRACNVFDDSNRYTYYSSIASGKQTGGTIGVPSALKIDYVCTGNQAKDIVGIAKTQVGYVDNGVNTAYGAWYGVQTEWCAIFVSWCADKAGIPTSIVPKLTTADRSWYQNRKIYQKSSYRGGTYTPKTGDIIFFSWDGKDYAQHVGMVEKVSNGIVYTVEGNSGNMVKSKSYPLKSSYILGYGTPKYEVPKSLHLSASNIASSGEVKLSWETHATAAKYYIYRSSSSNSGFTYIGCATGTTYIDSSGEPSYLYYYKVEAVASNEKSLGVSDVVTRTYDCAQPVPASIENVASTGKLKITWKDVKNADRYDMYRATSKNGTYKKMVTFETEMNTGKTYYYINNTDAVAGQTYFYKIRARNSKNSDADSALSPYIYRTCDLPRPEVTVTNRDEDGKPRILWNEVAGASKYEIYRATSETGSYQKMYTTSGRSYTNTSARPGVTYYYKVIAIHPKTSCGNSAFSTAVSAKCK